MKQIDNPSIGVLITNLGTPDAPTEKALRSYLAEFLSDPNVVKIPRLLWLPILYGVILRIRPKYSAALYQKIWTAEGSPLLTHTQNLVTALQKQFEQEIKVAVGMRYGKPTLAEALNQLKEVKKIIVLPLYPQYSSTTTGSTFAAIQNILKKWNNAPQINFVNHYYDQMEYTLAIANSLQHSNLNDPTHRLIFSFHGLPQRFVDQGDPYQQQCVVTAESIAQQLKIAAEKWQIVFQSRFGRAKWLTPYCSEVLKQLPNQGIKKVTVVCPGFAVDCLETLEEIAQLNRDIFLQAGGKEFNYIPTLNDSAGHVELLAKIIEKNSSS